MDIRNDENFLTDEESKRMRDTVYKLKPYWKHVSNLPANSEEVRSRYPQEVISHAEKVMENLNFLGEGIYVMDGKLTAIDKNIQEILKTEFDWLYNKVIEHFKSLYNTPDVILHDELPIPGFHIFIGNEQERRDFDWHNDSTVCLYAENVDTNSIFSFVILVETPEDTAHLDYKILNSSETHTLNYRKNCFHLWNGNLNHRIGSFQLKKDEARITFQGHIYHDKKQNNYKLYF
jgi:hypothetical protein